MAPFESLSVGLGVAVPVSFSRREKVQDEGEGFSEMTDLFVFHSPARSHM